MAGLDKTNIFAGNTVLSADVRQIINALDASVATDLALHPNSKLTLSNISLRGADGITYDLSIDANGQLIWTPQS
jgi:hypothetical protein